MAEDSVLLDIEDGLATITLNEPDRMNPVSPGLKADLYDHLIELENTSNLRCVTIEGAGDAFSAGGDINRMANLIDEGVVGAERAELWMELSLPFLRKLNNIRVPTIAKIDGPAVGAGASLAIACDLQLASDESIIGFVFRQVGLAVDASVSYHLPRMVGSNVAKQLVYTGEILNAKEAEEIGLVNEVYPQSDFNEKADEMIASIAKGPTQAFKQSKRLIESGLSKSVEEAIKDEFVAQGLLTDTADHREGINAFLEGRNPEMEGK